MNIECGVGPLEEILEAFRFNDAVLRHMVIKLKNAVTEDSVISYDISLVDNKKDPTCGMPVTAGISDTAHYDNKVIGFCAAGCKEEFLKNPKANIAAAEMK